MICISPTESLDLAFAAKITTEGPDPRYPHLASCKHTEFCYSLSEYKGTCNDLIGKGHKPVAVTIRHNGVEINHGPHWAHLFD